MSESPPQTRQLSDLFCLGHDKPILSFQIFKYLQSLNDLSLNYCWNRRPSECKRNKEYYFILNIFYSLDFCRKITRRIR